MSECVFTLVPSLGLFSFCWFSLSNFKVMDFALSYANLFGHVLLLPFRSLFFPNARHREDPDGRKCVRNKTDNKSEERCS